MEILVIDEFPEKINGTRPHEPVVLKRNQSKDLVWKKSRIHHLRIRSLD